MTYKCEDCDREFEGIIYFVKHRNKVHDISVEETYLRYKVNGIRPTCKCGCGSNTKFIGCVLGYNEYVRGHAARINNNWGHNNKARIKSLETRKQMIEDGEYKPFFLKETGEHWGKGLTKETDQRIANMVNSINNNPVELVKRSERMKRNRLNGVVPTLSREKHSQWKGGISALSNVCSSNKLFDEWKYPKLKESGFSCSKCGNNFYKDKSVKLEVHHDKELFSDIVRKIAKQNNWTEKYSVSLKENAKELFELKQKISDEVAEYHIVNNVSGVVLCKSCHQGEHDCHNF